MGDKARECICHASWSGYDEAEYRARGCPPCECWKVDAYEAAIKERDEAIAQRNAGWKDWTVINERDAARAELAKFNEHSVHISIHSAALDRCDAERAKADSFCKMAESYRAKLHEILDAGNMATQGKWDATNEMKNLAYAALEGGK